MDYRVLVESTKIENASFLYKTAISEANVKTNRTVSTKWTYHKEGSFTSNYFIFFWKYCFRLRTFSKELTWCTNHLNAHIRTFCKRWSFIWRYFFPVRSLMSQTETAISSYCGGGLQAEKFFQIFLYSRSSRAEVFLEHLWTAASYIPFVLKSFTICFCYWCLLKTNILDICLIFRVQGFPEVQV